MKINRIFDNQNSPRVLKRSTKPYLNLHFLNAQSSKQQAESISNHQSDEGNISNQVVSEENNTHIELSPWGDSNSDLEFKRLSRTKANANKQLTISTQTSPSQIDSFLLSTQPSYFQQERRHIEGTLNMPLFRRNEGKETNQGSPRSIFSHQGSTERKRQEKITHPIHFIHFGSTSPKDMYQSTRYGSKFIDIRMLPNNYTLQSSIILHSPTPCSPISKNTSMNKAETSNPNIRTIEDSSNITNKSINRFDQSTQLSSRSSKKAKDSSQILSQIVLNRVKLQTDRNDLKNKQFGINSLFGNVSARYDTSESEKSLGKKLFKSQNKQFLSESLMIKPISRQSSIQTNLNQTSPNLTSARNSKLFLNLILNLKSN